MANALLDAYRRTTFVADTSSGRLSIRVGQHCAELDTLLAVHGVTNWAYVTAFNPGSVPLSVEENAARQRRLESAVAELGLVSYPGQGVSDNSRWPPEQSLLILGITRLATNKLGSEFGQLAVVYGEKGHEAELLVCVEKTSL
jgi:hypothetical protein